MRNLRDRLFWGPHSSGIGFIITSSEDLRPSPGPPSLCAILSRF